MEHIAILGLIALIALCLIVISANIKILSEAVKRLWKK